MILQVGDGLLHFLVLAAVVVIPVVVHITAKVSDEGGVELVLGFDRHPRHRPDGRPVSLSRAEVALPPAGQEVGRDPRAVGGGTLAAPGAVGHLRVGRRVERRHSGPDLEIVVGRVDGREILTGRGSRLL